MRHYDSRLLQWLVEAQNKDAMELQGLRLDQYQVNKSLEQEKQQHHWTTRTTTTIPLDRKNNNNTIELQEQQHLITRPTTFDYKNNNI